MVREFHDDAGATRGRNWGYDSRARFTEGDLYRANYDAIRWGSGVVDESSVMEVLHVQRCLVCEPE